MQRHPGLIGDGMPNSFLHARHPKQLCCGDTANRDAVLSQLDIIIRNLYSNPPKHGANIVKTPMP